MEREREKEKERESKRERGNVDVLSTPIEQLRPWAKGSAHNGASRTPAQLHTIYWQLCPAPALNMPVN